MKQFTRISKKLYKNSYCYQMTDSRYAFNKWLKFLKQTFNARRGRGSECIYILFDTNKNPIYIGTSHYLSERLYSHACGSSFFSDVKYIKTFELRRVFSNEKICRAISNLEKDLIIKFKPKFNRVHNPDCRRYL